MTVAEEVRVRNGDVELRVDVTGTGPLVLCVPGFPELARSWRHQVAHLVDRGFRVAAMDVRGYGGSSVPDGVDAYCMVELAADAAAVVDALSDEPAVLLGHDWGAPIVYNTALRHPERVRAVAGMSVAYVPAAEVSLLRVLDHVWADRFMYMLHFREPGLVEAAMEADPRAALKRIYFAASGQAPLNAFLPDGPRDAAYLPLLPEPPAGPLTFLTDELLDQLADAFGRTGFGGAVNRYRAIDADVQADASLVGAKLQQPACFIAGARDPVRALVPGMDLYADPGANCVDFRGTTMIPGVGHWVQQEAPADVNAALDVFLDTL